MLRSIKYILCFTILIGVIGLSLNQILGERTITFIQKLQVDTMNTHFYIWKFDFWNYIHNIQISATNTSQLRFDLPTRNWNADLLNNLALILDYIILMINIFLYPIKVTSYLLQNVLALLGVNSQNQQYNGLYWLYSFVREILGRFAIPYI